MTAKIIRALLAGAPEVTEKVPADRIVAGVVKEGTALPALGITEVGDVPLGALDSQAEYSVVTQRVQVTAMCKTYPEVKALIKLVRRACNFQSGQIGGESVISIMRDTVGPDMDDVAGNCFQSIDFKVTYNEEN
jgi:Protein of unknown function (DUF3168)